jgi:TolB protein
MFAAFTAPSGLAIVATVVRSTDASQLLLYRLSLSGDVELEYPTSLAGGAMLESGELYSADGTELAVGTNTGIELMNNAGQDQRLLPVNSSVQNCRPVRWWTPEELLVACTHYGFTEQLFLVPTSGASPTALTATPPASQDVGDLDAWQLPSGTYVTDQTAYGCDTSYVAKIQPDGSTAPVEIPGVPTSYSSAIIGAEGERLAIASGPAEPAPDISSPCGQQTTTLQWFDPATNSVSPLLGGPGDGGEIPVLSYPAGIISDVVMFGEPAGSW